MTTGGIPDEPFPGEPVRGVNADPRALGMAGLDAALAYVNGSLPTVPVHHLTGLRPVDASVGRSTFTLPVTPWLTDNAGIIEPGVLAFLADAPLASAIYTGLRPGQMVATSELSLTFIQPVHRDAARLTARASVVHANRQVGVSTAEVDDSEGRLLAHATTRCVIHTVGADAAPSAAGSAASADPPDRPEPPDPADAPDPAASPDPYRRPVRGAVYPPELWDGMTGLEFCRALVDGTLDHGPVGYLLGTRMVAAADGTASWRMPTSRWLTAAGPALYGGAVASLAQLAQDLSIMTTLPPGTVFATLDLKIHFLRPVPPGTGPLTAVGEVTHRGRSIAVAQVRVINDQARTVAVSSGSAMLVPDGVRRMRRGDLPVPTLHT
jgi:uncharacterized protein (TIGR00369 family)